jgi:hypothetical protein
VHAGDPAAAEDALTEILWDYENSFEFVHYSVADSGHIDMTFASDTPNELYVEIITKAKNHPDISSVLAGKNGAVCGLFPR